MLENIMTLVLGVDAKHLQQLKLVYPTWAKHKPALTKLTAIIFYDVDEVAEKDIVLPKHKGVVVKIPWPPKGVDYPHGMTKWDNQQRYKMLAGFVHVPAQYVATPYWLKLDTDVVATGMSDWIDFNWFRGAPAIISHHWGYTKPADQIVRLDQWVEKNKKDMFTLSQHDPLNLHPEEGSTLVKHERIISWCGIFDTTITKFASQMARQTCGRGMLPVPSQDGFLWYVSTRLGHDVRRVNLKERGWEQWNSMNNIKKAVARSLGNA